MTQNLTETPSYDATLTLPADGEPGSIASLVAAFQMLLDRSAYLKQAIEAPLGNLTALSALTTQSLSGTSIRLVLGYGFYYFVPGDTTTPNSPLIVSGIGGRWYQDGGALVGSANGIAGLDSSQRLALGVARNGLIGITKAYVTTGAGTGAAFQTTGTGSAFVDITGTSATVTCNSGDILEVFGSACLAPGGSAPQLQLVTVVGGVTTPVPESLTLFSLNVSSGSGPVPLVGVYTAAAAGSVTLKMQINPEAHAQGIFAPTGIIVRQYRP